VHWRKHSGRAGINGGRSPVIPPHDAGGGATLTKRTVSRGCPAAVSPTPHPISARDIERSYVSGTGHQTNLKRAMTRGDEDVWDCEPA
jgi:hypothetical protein